LPAALLRKSFDALRRSNIVIAPSLDGGYYAIGVRGAMPSIFDRIKWGSRSVFAETVSKLKRAGVKYEIGPAWYDVDRASDVILRAEHLRLIARSGESPCPATALALKRLGLMPRPR
jgi:glycosyltransferase A (GT-A) superfamily protein (DUF2064 family)